MKITILTLFPELFQSFICTSMIGRAAKKNLVEFDFIDIRQFGEGVHQIVDGRPYGGGPGMVFRADILAKALKSIVNRKSLIVNRSKNIKKTYVILMSASGSLFKQKSAEEFSNLKHLVIVCGHYEGVDQRFIDKYVDEEISIGDYVLTGGEVPAMAVIDATVRLLPGVLNNEEATENESFSPMLQGLLEYPQYTRPNKFEKEKVPEVLISGNHEKIEQWRAKKSLEKTKKVRPELIKQ